MQLPHRFGKYLLTRKIAEGGMAEVYCAKYFGERGFTRELAVKRILPIYQNHRDYERMFIDEANILVKLQHPNIVQVFELGRDLDALFISMEYVDGVDLRRLVRKLLYEETELPEKFVCLIMLEALKALAFAHGRCDENGAPLKIIHRDISPQNILCSFSGEVKITDFGIAKSVSRTSTTLAGQVKGKYAYMSPEQARGEDVTPASDIYSLGIIFYELITGNRLFDGPSDFTILEQVKNGTLAEGWAMPIPAQLRTIFRRILDNNSVTRCSSASELKDELSGYVEAEGLAASPLEFAIYLKELFKAERSLVIQESDALEQEINRTEVTRSELAARAQQRHDRKTSGYRWQRSLSGGLCAVMLGFFCIGAKGGGAAIVSQGTVLPQPEPETLTQIENQVVNRVGKVEPAIALNDKKQVTSGHVVIDSLPSHVRGRLILGDVEKDITTPVRIDGIDLSRRVDSRLLLTCNGYMNWEEKFVLDAENPIFEKKILLKEKVRDGSISVVANPWGYVTIPGLASRRETPFLRSGVAKGRYLVQVYYEPEGRTVQEYVSLEKGESRNCIADFRGQATIRCR